MKKSIMLFCFILAVDVVKSQPLCDFRGMDSLFTIVVGDSVQVWDYAACGYCSSKFSISVSVTTDSITIVETDTASQVTTCDCIYNLGTLVFGIPGGTYSIVVYRDFPNLHYHGFIGALQLNYTPTATRPLAWFPFQLGCLPDLVPEVSRQIPKDFALFPNYPNPFNPSTTIRFSVAHQENVVLKVYDVLGKEITTLLSGNMKAGTYSLKLLLGPEQSSGVYFCRMSAGSFSQTIAMTLQR
jgi:hypothetical protein